MIRHYHEKPAAPRPKVIHESAIDIGGKSREWIFWAWILTFPSIVALVIINSM